MLSRPKTQITTNRFKIVGYTLDSYFTDMKKQVNIEIESKGNTLRRAPHMDRPFTMLSYWFHNRCKNSQKWFCLGGGVGSGKTTLMKAMYDYIKKVQTIREGSEAHHAPFSCRYLTSMELAAMMSEDKGTWNVIKNYQVLFIDDVGQEARNVMSYGNGVSPFVELINNRYNEQLGLVFTTNLSPRQFGEIYGERVADRLREECFMCATDGESMRKVSRTVQAQVEGCPF